MTNKTTFRRSSIAFALTMLAVLMALMPHATPAQAQTIVALVLNTAETRESGGNEVHYTQTFQTGANAQGYQLGNVAVRLESVTSGETTAVKIRENGSDSLPGNVVATLANPSTLSGAALNVFTAPAGTKLLPSTTYWLSVNDGISGSKVSYNITLSDTETGEAGWSIGNTLLWRANESNNWASEESSLVFQVSGYENNAPTADDGSVTADANAAYTFKPSDFNFADTDSGDRLEKVKIVTLPTDGTLALDGTNVTPDREITRTEIDDGDLTFTPEADATGQAYATFTFKVNDGAYESERAYTITINVVLGRGPYGDPVKAIIEVNSGWQEFRLETQVSEDWFRTTLEDNKKYYIRINTTPNTPRPRLGAAYDPDGNQHTHGSGADCSRTPLGTGCAGHGWFLIDLENESHRHGNFYFQVDAPHNIRPDPDEDFDPGENPYTYSVMVESTTTSIDTGRSAPPSPLRAFFNDEPDDHNGSDPFTLQLAFDDSIRGDGDDIDAAMTVTNGSLTGITQNEWDISRWDLTITPSAAADITLELAASVPCDEDGALCTLIGRRLKQRVQTSIDYTPPPPTISSVTLVSDAGDNDRWDANELVTAEVVFTAPVYIQGQPTLGITVTGTRHEAAYASGDTTSTLRFSYRVTSDEAGAINAGLLSDGFNTGTGTLFDSHAQLAVLDFDVDESAALVGQFQNVPTNHDGNSRRFTFNIQFSLDPALNASDIRDDIFTVTNGDVKRVQRTKRQGDNRNSRWLIKVKPTGEADVTITLPVTTNCGRLGAVCTSNGTKFSSQISLTVPRTAPAVVINSAATGAPTISGTAQVGQTLTASTSGISDSDGLTSVAYTYQWLADDVEITGATGSTYTLTTTDQNKAIKVTVSFTDDADNSESLTSAATSAVAAAPTTNNPATGLPTISGTTTTGNTLTAVTSGITDADGMENAEFSYQWLRADAAISGATASTYTLVSADAGNAIKVRVSFTDDNGNSESVTSAGTASISSTPTNTPATGQPSISGTATVGSSLSVGTSAIRDANGITSASFAYQWLRSDSAISGATGSTYTVTSADAGQTIKVRVSFTDDDGFSESVTSAGLDIPTPASPPSAPTGLSGTENSDGSITLTWTAPNDDSVTSYQVLRRRPAEGETTLLVYVNSTGSTATTYTDTGTTLDNTHYVYRVKARNSAGLSRWSNFARIDK